MNENRLNSDIKEGILGMYLTIGIARKIIRAEFAGQSRVPTWHIINTVEQEHCRGSRKLSENEKQIVHDALRSLREKSEANNFERGYWSFSECNTGKNVENKTASKEGIISKFRKKFTK
ncbi:MAG: hypothetical protein OXH00_16785 [Candidatus Poribacteria bacterium]|nr:hypothetical protein [Candidatus Poribacteria bacterium]